MPFDRLKAIEGGAGVPLDELVANGGAGQRRSTEGFRGTRRQRGALRCALADADQFTRNVVPALKRAPVPSHTWPSEVLSALAKRTA